MDFTAIRKELHRYPERSNHERDTAKRVRQFLDEIGGIDDYVNFDGYGFAVVYRGRSKGQRIVVRCELDALPIEEINTFDYASKTNGVSHKCGHDGHMTILLALAQRIARNKPDKGEIVLLFQAAEETGDGAVEALNSPAFKRIEPDFIYALHNIPGRPSHEIMVREGAFTPSVKSLIFRFKGKTSHAAEPEKGINPALAMAETIRMCDDLTLNSPERDDFFLITPVYTTMGETAYGISAGYGEVHLTIRAWDEELLVSNSQKLIDDVTALAHKSKLDLSHEWCYEFQANLNHPDAVQAIQKAAESLNMPLRMMSEPFKFGEDFGIFTQHYKGAMFGLGAGESTPALHNPDYDFPDEIRETGMQLFYHILKHHLDLV